MSLTFSFSFFRRSFSFFDSNFVPSPSPASSASSNAGVGSIVAGSGRFAWAAEVKLDQEKEECQPARTFSRILLLSFALSFALLPNLALFFHRTPFFISKVIWRNCYTCFWSGDITLRSGSLSVRTFARRWSAREGHRMFPTICGIVFLLLPL